MNYNQFKQKILVAVEYAMTIEELEEHIQDLYSTWKMMESTDFISFCEEQITGTPDDSLFFLSYRGMHALKLEKRINNLSMRDVNPVAGRRS